MVGSSPACLWTTRSARGSQSPASMRTEITRASRPNRSCVRLAGRSRMRTSRTSTSRASIWRPPTSRTSRTRPAKHCTSAGEGTILSRHNLKEGSVTAPAASVQQDREIASRAERGWDLHLTKRQLIIQTDETTYSVPGSSAGSEARSYTVHYGDGDLEECTCTDF